MIVVVSDTSPIRALHHLDLLSLLPSQFERILIPPSVFRELSNPSTRFRSISKDDIPFAEVATIADPSRLVEIRKTLDPGEAEAICLALETQGASILIDEADGRKLAHERGLKVVGTLRVLLEGKRTGRIPQVVPLVQRLIDELTFYISPKTLNDFRLLAGE